MGDFNEILHQSEKYGGKGWNRRLMKDFQSTLIGCELVDLGYRGPKFTWNNGRGGDDFIQERLDRVVANEGWCGLLLKADVLVEGAVNSDHLPIFVTLKEDQQRGRVQFSFKHKAHWVLDGAYSEVVKPEWKRKKDWVDCWDDLRCKMGSYKLGLKKWKKINRGTKEGIKGLCHNLTEMQSKEGLDGHEEIGQLKEKI